MARMDDRVGRLAVIGAGPIGLEAALEAATRGWDVAVYEAGRVGEHLRRYGETVLFTPFGMNSSALGRERLASAGVRVPGDDDLLSGVELTERYLAPLAALPALRASVRERTRVTHAGREGLAKTGALAAAGDSSRERRTFLLRIEDPESEARFETADVVIDAGGVYGQPNATGPGGLPASGEELVHDRIDRHLPSTTADARERYGGRRVLLVGDGHSAATALRMLAGLARANGDFAPARVEWVHRDRGGRACFEEVPGDPLPARLDLAREANRIAASAPWLASHPGATIMSYKARSGGALRVVLADGGGDERSLEVDRVLALVGYRPDLTITRELQIHHCYASEGPMRLASAILSASLASPAGAGDCLSEAAHGPESLLHPEPGFFVLGAKSYGRNPRFLLSIGHRQILDAFTLIGEPRRAPTPAPPETAPSTAS